MAYTKAPVSDTHNVIRIPAEGSSFIVSSESTNNATPLSLNYIDCYPKLEGQWGTNPRRTVYKREGWEPITVSGGTITSLQVFSRSIVLGVDSANDKVWCAIGSVIYEIDNYNTATPVMTAEQTGITQNTSSSATGTLAVDATNTLRVCWLDGAGNLYTWKQDGTGNTTTTPAMGLNGGGNLVFLNGYLFALSNGDIYNSNPAGDLTTWNTTNFLTPEIYPDKAYWIDKHKNHLVAFGENSVEFFYDGAIEIGSPLVRQEAYAVNIGLASISETMRVAKIQDDLYFLGRATNQQINLYRIRDFKVEELDCPYFNNAMNWVNSSSNYQEMYGVQTIIVNNQSMIAVSGTKGYDMVYSPEDDCWWLLRTVDENDHGLPVINPDFPGPFTRVGSAFSSVGLGYRPATMISYEVNTGVVSLYRPAKSVIPSVQADIYTGVIDFGINYYKHIARVDAIGDYGNNVLTLEYNPTPNYGQSYVACTPTRTPSSEGYGNNASWYNLGAMRRMSLHLKLVGTGQFLHEGFDVEYNVGAT